MIYESGPCARAEFKDTPWNDMLELNTILTGVVLDLGLLTA